MANQQETLLTAEGKRELEAQLPLLIAKKREIMERIQGAKTYGDMADGGEYSEAKDELAQTDGRIKEIEQMLRYAKIVEGGAKDGVVRIGCRVTVRDTAGQQETWTIVVPAEASTRNRKISNQSPMGVALLGKRVGDQVRVQAPDGDIFYTITAIE